MPTQPVRSIPVPSIRNFCGQRILGPKRDKIRDVGLIPVRKIPTRDS